MRISDWSSDVGSSDLGIARALDRPVVPVSTLAALAAGAPETGSPRILAAIDARMGEVYSGAFELRDGGLAALSNESVCAPDVVALPAGDDHWQGIGTGFAAVDGALQARLGRRLANVDATALPDRKSPRLNSSH